MSGHGTAEHEESAIAASDGLRSLRSLRCAGMRTLKKTESTIIGRNGKAYHYAYDSVTVSASCESRVLWEIKGVGVFCNVHFERYIVSHEVDPDDIVRLSDDERDFAGKGRR